MATLTKVTLPAFGRAQALPALPSKLFLARLAALRERMREHQLDVIAVYGDREHFANLAYLTGLDPRFEEALLLVSTAGRKLLLVGNECQGYLPDTKALGLDVALFQEFSLMGQPRGNSRPLADILKRVGIGKGVRVGCVGWKYFDGKLIPGGELALDVPAYLADLLRTLAGGRRQVVNATAILMDSETGLRVTNEPAQLAQFEYAGTVASEGVRRVLRHLAPRVREQDLERHLDAAGLPLTCHRMLGFGDKARRGLASASARVARRGDAFTVAFGVTGGLTCRAGVIARGPQDLPPRLRTFYPRFAANYFDCVAAWYEAVGVGAVAGDVYRAVVAVRDPKLFAFAVNPGHYLHLDEWVHSPFARGSRVVLRSGMMLQADLIPVSKGPFCYSNAEDGVFLADAALQRALARQHPECWARCLKRRRFMADALGIRLHDTVFPTGNTPGWLPPYALDLDRVLTRS
jgi:hypothetical protein